MHSCPFLLSYKWRGNLLWQMLCDSHLTWCWTHSCLIGSADSPASPNKTPNFKTSTIAATTKQRPVRASIFFFARVTDRLHLNLISKLPDIGLGLLLMKTVSNTLVICAAAHPPLLERQTVWQVCPSVQLPRSVSVIWTEGSACLSGANPAASDPPAKVPLQQTLHCRRGRLRSPASKFATVSHNMRAVVWLLRISLSAS